MKNALSRSLFSMIHLFFKGTSATTEHHSSQYWLDGWLLMVNLFTPFPDTQNSSVTKTHIFGAFFFNEKS